MGRKKIYQTEEERKEAKREAVKRWREKNPEKEKERRKRWYQENADYQKERMKRYYQENADYRKEYKKQYRKTPMGRAANLVNSYKLNDKKYNRGECTLTAQWIIDNIFTKPCHYCCGKEGWEVIGCDRIDNSKPHTEDNVVPCCDECNTKRGRKTYEEFLMTLKNEQSN